MDHILLNLKLQYLMAPMENYKYVPAKVSSSYFSWNNLLQRYNKYQSHNQESSSVLKGVHNYTDHVLESVIPHIAEKDK